MKHLFGTDGIRAQMGTYPLTQEGLFRIGKVFGIWATQGAKPNILIATDTRASSPFCRYTLSSGLLQSPITLYDAHILPTPVLHYLIQKYDYDYGIIITASHNTADYNGIKILTKNGKLSPCEQEELMNLIKVPNIDTCNYNTDLGKSVHASDLFEKYHERLEHNFQSTFLKNHKIVIDCAHGAWSYYAEKVFKKFGAEVISIASSGFNNEINHQCGSLHPEKIQDAVLKHGAFAGLAFDGDGDRVALVNHKGEIKDGDDIIALLLQHPRYKKNTGVVISQFSNEGLIEYVNSLHKTALRVPVGDSNILDALKENQLTLGGEPSGHIMLRDFSETSDALFTGLRILETMILTHNIDCTTFTKYPQKIINIPVSMKKNLDEVSFQELIKTQKDLLNKSRIMVRYSGTEPVVRILIEYANEDDTEVVTRTIIPAISHYFI